MVFAVFDVARPLSSASFVAVTVCGILLLTIGLVGFVMSHVTGKQLSASSCCLPQACLSGGLPQGQRSLVRDPTTGVCLLSPGEATTMGCPMADAKHLQSCRPTAPSACQVDGMEWRMVMPTAFFALHCGLGLCCLLLQLATAWSRQLRTSIHGRDLGKRLYVARAVFHVVSISAAFASIAPMVVNLSILYVSDASGVRCVATASRGGGCAKLAALAAFEGDDGHCGFTDKESLVNAQVTIASDFITRQPMLGLLLAACGLHLTAFIAYICFQIGDAADNRQDEAAFQQRRQVARDAAAMTSVQRRDAAAQTASPSAATTTRVRPAAAAASPTAAVDHHEATKATTPSAVVPIPRLDGGGAPEPSLPGSVPLEPLSSSVNEHHDREQNPHDEAHRTAPPEPLEHCVVCLEEFSHYPGSDHARVMLLPCRHDCICKRCVHRLFFGVTERGAAGVASVAVQSRPARCVLCRAEVVELRHARPRLVFPPLSPPSS